MQMSACRGGKKNGRKRNEKKKEKDFYKQENSDWKAVRKIEIQSGRHEERR